ncbi:patatin-like phospholipase family protein [Aureimonas pseudogalii]|uniref:NTE family protein n=1 Tax=Aureimonas pseudogalii TaxID=1744844 RepID=A0A7W6H4T4_9HYPH|nr:patatin-like phospholipase family protein [Aureimonas pseudogalii]MBB3998164.1 NTE family protein [Aureimonas pseudogalii]
MPRVCLALQGGGAHGAFTWGVLDRLLEVDGLEIAAVSGTSAGALNAASLAVGLAKEGPAAARAALLDLWQTVSRLSPLGAAVNSIPFFPLPRSLLHRALERIQFFNQFVSPYSAGLPRANALRRVVETAVDLDLLRRQTQTPTFISATDVESGTARVFTGEELTADALLASACLPDIFRAVEIDGRAYWDGGYLGNPVLTPFFAEDRGTTDILIVQVTPFVRAGVPEEPTEIMGRVNEITFNASLLRDLRMLTEVARLAKGEDLENPVLRRIASLRLHMISAGDALTRRGTIGKLDTRWSELTDLRDLGRAAAERWLAAHEDDLGRRSSLEGNYGLLS